MGVFSDILKRDIGGTIREEDQNVESLVSYLNAGKIVEFEFYENPDKKKIRNVIGFGKSEEETKKGISVPMDLLDDYVVYCDLENTGGWHIFRKTNFVHIIRLIEPDQVKQVLSKRELSKEK